MLHFRKIMFLSTALLFAAFISLLFLCIDLLFNTSERPAEIVIGSWKIALLFLGGSFFFSLLTWILFNRLNRPFQKILERNKEFIANASHEFKTPITII